MPGRIFLRGTGAIFAAAIAFAGGAGEARAQSLPLPPGTILTEPVFKHLPSCGGLNPQPSITTGTNANDYICEPPAVARAMRSCWSGTDAKAERAALSASVWLTRGATTVRVGAHISISASLASS